MAISPGQPIIQMGQWIYQETYGQQAPSRSRVSWWLRWMNDWYGTRHRSPLINRLRGSGNRYLGAIFAIAPQGAKLAAIEERAPAYQSPEPAAGALFLGRDASGWSMDRMIAHSISQQGLSWVVKEIREGRLENLRYLDLFLHHLVQVPERDMRLPLPYPECANMCTPESMAVWSSYLQQTNFTGIRSQVRDAWKRQVSRNRLDNDRYRSFLDAANRTMSWVSLHRPFELLGEKLNQFFALSTTTKDRIGAAERLLAKYPSLATPERRKELNRLQEEMRRNDWIAYQALNPLGLWQGQAPSPLAGYTGMGAVTIAVGASALVALGIVATGIVIYTALATSAERSRASIAKDAMSAARQEAEALEDVFDRREHLLRNQLVTGEITQTAYNEGMLTIARDRAAALAKNREQRERIAAEANEGKGDGGPLAPFAKSLTAIGVVGTVGYFGHRMFQDYQQRRRRKV